MAKIRRTAEARLDYLQIFIYIGERNLPAAERLIESFDEKLRPIASMPGIGPARPELGAHIRSCPVGDYILLYRQIPDGIELLRAVHGARNLRRLFKRRR
jgi:toxin ParE1/3/4